MEKPQSISCTKLVSSPGGTLVAVLHPPYLCIRDAATLLTVRCITLPTDVQIRTTKIRWAPIEPGSQDATRFILGDEQSIRIWDLRDPKWTVHISNGSAGMGKIAEARFGLMGEVLVWNDFGSRLTVWDVKKGKGLELKDPKYSDDRGYGYRPGPYTEARTFALLTRPGPHDILSLHTPGLYNVIKSILLPTADAQGIKWSPDGRWIAIWDAPREGHRVVILTCDGYIYRHWTGQNFVKDVLGLGVRCLEWSASGDCLAIGDFDGRVTLLNTRTFQPVSTLMHAQSVDIPQETAFQIFTETSNSASNFTVHAYGWPYDIPQAPIETSKSKATKRGVSHLRFSPTGRFLASVSSTSPTTVFIWSMPDVLVQQSASPIQIATKPSLSAIIVHLPPIVLLSWAPGTRENGQSEVLLSQTSQNGQSNAYIWTEPSFQNTLTTSQTMEFNFDGPQKISTLPFVNSADHPKRLQDQKVNPTVSWLGCSGPHLGIAVCDGARGTILWPFGRPEHAVTSFAQVQGEEPAHQHKSSGEEPNCNRLGDDDSLFDILMGRTQVASEETETVFRQGPLEDTFGFRKETSKVPEYVSDGI